MQYPDYDSDTKFSVLKETERSPTTDGLTIDVVNISYGLYLGSSKQFKKILHDVSFHLKPGSLCALMGPSGSGKSTLLDLLADRTLIGEWSGTILFNGGPRSRWFSRDSAYILQDDLHVSTLTVREAIYFAACCKLPEGTSKEVINQRVQELLDVTGLHVVQNSIIGDPSKKGISGGQLKRLSIAVEIVSLPKTIFLDEPTSGLDSTIALDVMAAIRRIANQNRTCISTIHQPSTAVYAMFDTIVLLSRGHLIYFGPAKEVVTYFTSAPLPYFYIPGQNPAEFILEVSEGVITPIDITATTAIDNDNSTSKSNDDQPVILSNIVPSQDQFVHKYQCSSYYIPPNTNVIATAAISLTAPGANDNTSSRLHATTKWTQFRMLLWRDGLSIVRDTDAFYAMLAKSIIVGLLIGIVFFRQGVTTVPLFNPLGVPYAEVQNISALLFFGMMHSMITNVEAIPHICSKNLIFRREVNSFAYSVSPYWLTSMISHLPLQFVGYVIFVTITFFLCHFKQTFDYFIYYAFAVFLANVCSYNIALLLGAMVKREGTALVAFPLIFLFFSTFAGYPILIPDVPAFWSWAPTINFVRWCYQGLMVNQWSSYDNEANANGSVLALYDFQNWNKYVSYAILIGMFVVTSLCAYVAMRPPTRQLVWLSSGYDMGKKYIIQRRKRRGGRDDSNDSNSVDGDGVRVYRFSSFLENSLGVRFSFSGLMGPPGGTGSSDITAAAAAGNNYDQSHNSVTSPLTTQMNNNSGTVTSPKSKPKLLEKYNKDKLTKSATETHSPLAEALISSSSVHEDEHDDVEEQSQQRRSSRLSAPNHSNNNSQYNNQSFSSYAPPLSTSSATSATSATSPKKPLQLTLRQNSRRLFANPQFHENGGSNNDNTPMNGFTLTFQDIWYEVPIPPNSNKTDSNSNTNSTNSTSNNKNTSALSGTNANASNNNNNSLSILKGVSGYAKPGEICALMGSSGAGKTTLLDILADRKTIGTVTGRIAINGQSIVHASSRQLLKQVTAYVMQENVLIGSLTVQEHLYYAARLRLCYKEYHGEDGIQQRVQDLLVMLGLTHIAQSMVGSEGDRGISGGQKKRLSIGVEIIHFPEIIFLDEPTTGLDSAISFEVMSTIRLLANQERTVVCTIHQPSPATYALFDTLLLLSAGRVIYFGSAKNAIPYFSDAHVHLQDRYFPYLLGSNPAEFVIAVASGAIAPVFISDNEKSSINSSKNENDTSVGAGVVVDTAGLIEDLATLYLTSSDFAESQLIVSHDITATTTVNAKNTNAQNWETIAKKSHVNTVFDQVPVLMARMFLVKRREYHLLALSLIKSVVIALFYGTIFYHLPTGSDANVYLNRISIIFFSLISLLMSHQADIPDILEQRLLFHRERASQSITTESYWLAKFCLDAPFNAIFVLLYASILYHLCLLRAGTTAFGYFYYVLWTTDIIAYFAAQFVANISPSSEVAMSLFPVLMFFALAFEGFIIYVPQFPVWSQWATYVSYLRYAYQALILTEFQDNNSLPLASQYLDELGFLSISRNTCAAYLWLFVLLHALAAYLVLKYVTFIKR